MFFVMVVMNKWVEQPSKKQAGPATAQRQPQKVKALHLQGAIVLSSPRVVLGQQENAPLQAMGLKIKASATLPKD